VNLGKLVETKIIHDIGFGTGAEATIIKGGQKLDSVK
jgi:hypothetical protein